jgi:putative hemolysin
MVAERGASGRCDEFGIDRDAPRALGAELRAALGGAGLQQFPLAKFALSAIARWLALDWVDQLHKQISDSPDANTFVAAALRHIGVEIDVEPADIAQIPNHGRLIVVANHPFGCVEGLILCHILANVRHDVRLLANYLLQPLQPLRQKLILVDPFGGPTAAAANVLPMRRALRWLKTEGALAMFPAGEVAHWRMPAGRITETPWSAAAARLVRLSHAPVLPVYFGGKNSALFNMAGLVHARLRTAMLARELRRLNGRTIGVHIGTVIPFELLSEMEDGAMVAHLRHLTLDLARGTQSNRAKPIISPIPPSRLVADIAALPPSSTLLRSADYQVICAQAELIPSVLKEIGRLRELCFRATGQGSGQTLDLDQFDRDYLHLLLWHQASKQVVGAYRLGQTDKLLLRKHVAGLYTATLFEFSARGIARINPGLELGRSFVRPEFQKSHQPLMLLWKGICRFVASNPRYAVWLGAVSISQSYGPTQRDRIVRFMRAHHALKGAQDLVRARRPWRAEVGTRDGGLWDDENESPPAMPVLLRHYLNLGGKLLDVSVDPQFGNCLDALLMFDLRGASRRLLDFFMGPGLQREFLAYHGINEANQCEVEQAASGAHAM